MIVAIVFTATLYASQFFTDHFIDAAHSLINQIDFQHVLLKIMLGFLLFAGALHTNFDQLKVQRWPVLVFSGDWYRDGVYSLPVVWSLDLTDRPDCSSGNSQAGRCAQDFGNQDRGRIAVQRRCWRGRVHDDL